MDIIQQLVTNLNYTVSVILFLIGLYGVVAKPNLIKKFMGLNIMETAVFLLLISVGAASGGAAPIVGPEIEGPFANPLPQALVLTGIVVAVSVTALGLALIVKIYEHCGTLDAEELREME